MKEKIFAVSAGVTLGIACVSSCFSPPTEVYADAGSFAGAVDYILSATGDSASFITTSGGAFTAGAMVGIYMCTRDPLNAGIGDLDASSISICSGYYTFNGSLRTGYIATYNDSSGGAVYSDSRIPMIYATDYRLTVVNNSNITSGSVLFSSDANGSGLSVALYPYADGNSWIVLDSRNPIWQSGTYNGYKYYDGYSYGATVINISNWSVPEIASYSELKIVQGLRGLGGNSTYLLKQTPFPDSLPAGTINISNPSEYVNNILRPYIVENYPEYIYMLPDPPDEPEPTLDPSETMPGLPIVTLPTVPAPEYDLELPEKMLEGTGFWFSALTKVLDEMGWLAIVIVLAVIAIVLYYVF